MLKFVLRSRHLDAGPQRRSGHGAGVPRRPRPVIGLGWAGRPCASRRACTRCRRRGREGWRRARAQGPGSGQAVGSSRYGPGRTALGHTRVRRSLRRRERRGCPMGCHLGQAHLLDLGQRLGALQGSDREHREPAKHQNGCQQNASIDPAQAVLDGIEWVGHEGLLAVMGDGIVQVPDGGWPVTTSGTSASSLGFSGDTITMLTRRFEARPSGVAFEAIG
ncbi:hypothetical protein GALL_364230 [mine drainage metagenome]|uniref:Uncharacterized protein n=1 Tax=mine drainage metagenome TaxID=410659 RepID=A0A1J5QEC8_9ZZZZ